MTSQTPYEDLLRDHSVKASKTSPEALFASLKAVGTRKRLSDEQGGGIAR